MRWRDQPEMLRFSGRMVLSHGRQSISMRPFTNGVLSNEMVVNEHIHLADGLVVRAAVQGFRLPPNNVRVDFSDLRTGKGTGHFPMLGTMTPFAEVFFFGDLMIAHGGRSLVEPNKAVIFRNYRQNVEWYADSPP